MSNVVDFVLAALPWVAIGLALAIFFVSDRAQKEKGENEKDNYASEGMSLGMCFGVAIGSSIPGGVGIGIILGMVIGYLMGKNTKKKDRQDS